MTKKSTRWLSAGEKSTQKLERRTFSVPAGKAIGRSTELPKKLIESQNDITDTSLPPLSDSFDYPLIVAV